MKFFEIIFKITSVFLFISFVFLHAEQNKLSNAALTVVDKNIIYNPTYFKIAYPNGDIPSEYGVCTDVVIRAYRKIGIDLQKEVHEDMRDNFNKYPNNWGLKTTDKNIDHRRVLNLMTFFSRNGNVKKISKNPQDYEPGDIVTWDLGGGLTHIGIVVDRKTDDNKRYMVVHNIGAGQVVEDILFNYKTIGHYAY